MAESCLIVIDLQNDFLDKLEPRRRAKLIQGTNELLQTYRDARCPVIWVTTSFQPDLSDAFLEMRDRQISVAVEDTIGAAIDPELQPHADESVVVKKRYSAFFGTELDRILNDIRPDFVTLAGVNTHACVRMTAIDAYQRDFRLVLALDCLDSLDAEHARVSMAYMTGKIAAAKTNAQIASMLS